MEQTVVIEKKRTLVQSDALPWLRQFLESLPDFAPIIREYLQIRWVLDANVVNAELRWRAGKRRNSSARSALHEVIVSGLVIAIVPEFLASEIELHIPDIARDTDSAVGDVQREWTEFRELLHFYVPQDSPKLGHIKIVDAKDLEYIATSQELGVPVYSRDYDIEQMQAPVVTVVLDLSLRQYARGAAIQMAVFTGTTITIRLGFAAIAAACRALQKAVAAFQKIPMFIQLAIISALIVLLAHPRFRVRLSNLAQRLRQIAAPVVNLALEVAEQFERAASNVEASHEEIVAALPELRKRSALMHARTICLLAGKPLSLVEIERRMKAEGYTSRAKVFRLYLRRLLINSSQFVEVGKDEWILQPS